MKRYFQAHYYDKRDGDDLTDYSENFDTRGQCVAAAACHVPINGRADIIECRTIARVTIVQKSKVENVK